MRRDGLPNALASFLVAQLAHVVRTEAFAPLVLLAGLPLVWWLMILTHDGHAHPFAEALIGMLAYGSFGTVEGGRGGAVDAVRGMLFVMAPFYLAINVGACFRRPGVPPMSLRTAVLLRMGFVAACWLAFIGWMLFVDTTVQDNSGKFAGIAFLMMLVAMAVASAYSLMERLIGRTADEVDARAAAWVAARFDA